MGLTSIVMLCKDGLEMTCRCIDSISRHTKEPYEFIFVDNGSQDGTSEYLGAFEGATIIFNASNRGFSAGVNQGLAAAKGDYILLLNNDTVVTPNWLEGLLECFRRDPEIGITGPVSFRIPLFQRVSDDGPASLDELDAYAVRRKEMFSGKGFYTDKLTGYCMLISRRVVERIGGFDERFYPGNYEDDDYSIRARIGGYRLWVAEDIFVHHEGQGTFRKMPFSYTKMSILNAERFRRKWNVGSSAYEIFFRGYNPSEIVERETLFDPRRHFIAL
ncbi:glycosyltransferase family 2 protein [Paenibacillus sp. DYY-L-2]|uniref:glycosyltransferase family 2 protein n=1 Tax=Paenibacillus sp. DYY-L-2 TaxID=3447013 RepID=UPI003F50B323